MIWPLLLFSLLFLCWGCKSGDQTRIADVDGEPILAVDFEKTAGQEFFRQRETLYRLQQRKLDEYIGALLLSKEAKRRGVSIATLLDHEVNSKILQVADDEVEAFYNANKAGLPVELGKVRQQIREYLRNQKIDAQKALFLNSLRSKAKVVTYLKSPPVFRAEVQITAAPFKGPEKAAVTIVKFEDFHCPFCKQVQPIFSQILSRYNGKVRLVHKDLPLDSLHPLARQAAEAARCADEQGKFWSYHDLLYANSPKARPEELKGFAREIGLELDFFDKCLTSGKSKAAVQKDLLEASRLGITGTPTFFINGREMSGNQPLETFVEIIDEELAGSR